MSAASWLGPLSHLCCTHGGVVNHVIANEAVLAADAYAIRPLLERVRTARANIIVLHRHVVAGQCTLCNVQTGPTARVVGPHKLNKLIRVRATHLYVGAAIGGRRSAPRSVDLRETGR